MAFTTLAVFPLPEIHSYTGRLLASLIAIGGRGILHRCDWSDEHCNCSAVATVSNLAAGAEYCERHHLQAVRRG